MTGKKLLIGIGVLLILLGGHDFYNWATIGKELLVRYPEMPTIKELVNYNLIGGVIKCGIGGMTIVVSLLRFKHNR